MNQLEEKGVRVIACRDNITDHATELKGVRPRGWPSWKTWDDVPGAGGGNQVIIATKGTADKRRIPRSGEGHNSKNLVLHEAGHTLEDEAVADKTFLDARQKDMKSLRAYYKQPGRAGPSETFAEGIAEFYSDPKAMQRESQICSDIFNQRKPHEESVLEFTSCCCHLRYPIMSMHAKIVRSRAN